MSNHIVDANKMIGGNDLPATGKMVSYTPRTDEAEVWHEEVAHYHVVGSDLARQLERELNAANQRVTEREEYVTELENRLRALWDKYDGERKHYMERIKRLEEFVNRFLNPDDLGWAIGKYDRDEAREALGKERVESKAKEAKP